MQHTISVLNAEMSFASVTYGGTVHKTFQLTCISLYFQILSTLKVVISFCLRLGAKPLLTGVGAK